MHSSRSKSTWETRHHELLWNRMQEAPRFRSVSGHFVFLSADRPDIGFSMKERSRGMSEPTPRHKELAKKVIGYLAMNRRMLWRFHNQNEPQEIHPHFHSHNGGCAFTRRSTSGGLILHGGYLIHMWSSMQSATSSSSAYYAMLKGDAEALFAMNLCSELGMHQNPPEIRAVSSAVRATATREVVGSVKHFAMRVLWLQNENTPT